MKYPLTQCKAYSEGVRILYRKEQHDLEKIAHQLTVQSCWPSSFERQYVKLFSESTSAGLKIQDNSRNYISKTKSAEFTSIIVSLWKLFNVSTPHKGTRLNEEFSNALIRDDPRFSFLQRIVFWIDSWELTTRTNEASLSRQTFTSLRHSCLTISLTYN